MYSKFGIALDIVEHQFTTGDSVYEFANSWAPNRDTAGGQVGYIVNDFFGHPADGGLTWPYEWSTDTTGGHVEKDPTYDTPTAPMGGELFDVEAIYFTADDVNMYLAIVTSLPPPPGVTVNPGSGNVTVSTGDLAIHTLDGDYEYGVDINHADLGDNSLGTDATIGSELYDTDISQWYVTNLANATPAAGEHTNFHGDGTSASNYIGGSADGISVNYLNTNLMEGFELNVIDPQATTWEVDIIIPRVLLPEYDPALMTAGDSRYIGFSFIPGCRNDGNDTRACIRLDTSLPVPEPGTFVMTGLGLLGLMFLKRRKSGLQEEDE